METHNLIQANEEFLGNVPSTRGNSWSVFHDSLHISMKHQVQNIAIIWVLTIQIIEWSLSEGSNKYDEGVQGWKITDLNDNVLVQGHGRIQCAKADASSLRPELIVILVVMMFVSFVWESVELNQQQERPKIMKMLYYLLVTPCTLQ